MVTPGLRASHTPPPADRSRPTPASGTGAKGWDHDPPPARTWTALGILVLATGALSLFFGPRETSDLWADGLGRWWDRVKGGLGHVRRLVVYLDNGPNCSGTRTQFLKRMADFVDASGLEVRLVYYPPYHSKYNPVERCWSALERKWRGGLLTSLEVIFGYVRRMTWQGMAPAVDHLAGECPGGVRLTKAPMKPTEARLEQSKTLPKYDITIRPKTPDGRKRITCPPPKQPGLPLDEPAGLLKIIKSGA